MATTFGKIIRPLCVLLASVVATAAFPSQTLQPGAGLPSLALVNNRAMFHVVKSPVVGGG